MRLGKNKKKQWRRCCPGIEDEIQRAKELNEINDISFDISNKTAAGKGKEMKFSTVPRKFARRPHIRYPAKESVDIWAENDDAPKVSKRQKELLENMTRYKKSTRVIHPGTSYQPLAADHADLLHRLQDDHERKIKELRMAEKKMEVPMEEETPTDEVVDEELMEDDQYVKKDGLRKVKCLSRKEKKKRIHNLVKEKLKAIERKKGKQEAHLLRNIPQIKKQIVQGMNTEKKRREQREERKEVRSELKAEIKSLEKTSFLLPSEVPSCLRKLVPDTDIFSDITEKFDGHKFKVEKRKKHKKLTKMFKKSGLV